MFSGNIGTAVRVMLRGKAHAEWKVVVSGDRRTLRDDQYIIDDRAVIWGHGEIQYSHQVSLL